MSEHILKRKETVRHADRTRTSLRRRVKQPHEETSSAPLLTLQSTIGNAAVNRLIQKTSDTRIQRLSLGGLWDAVSDLGGKAWDALQTPHTDQASQPSQSDQSSQSQPTVSTTGVSLPPGQWTVTDKDARVYKPPPKLKASKGVIPEGINVTLVDGAYKSGKYYVHLQEALPENTSGPLRDFGWTAAANLNGLPDALTSANPDLAPYELPGVPTKPDLDSNAAFAAIVQELETMEQNPLSEEGTHGEEFGDARTTRLKKIAEVRQLIAGLRAHLPTLETKAIKEAQAYLYRRLAPLAPYYNQMANSNMLAKASPGWDRTCNVTVPAMVIEGLGKSKDNYDQARVPLLKRIFAALEGKYKTRKVLGDISNFDSLRLPEFMTLAAIARKLPKGGSALEGEAFVEAVSNARTAAAEATTSHSTMMYLIDQFGGAHSSGRIHAGALEKIGTARKAYIKSQLRGIAATKEQKAKYESVKADELLQVETYREDVLTAINPILNRGSQVLVGMENHFVRLDALDEDGVSVDDPGEKGFKNMRVTWEQARDLGYFKKYWEITPKT